VGYLPVVYYHRKCFINEWISFLCSFFRYIYRYFFCGLDFGWFFSIRLCQGIPQFTDVPRWGGTAEEFDHVLLVSCCGLAVFLFAAKIREKFFSYPRMEVADKKSAIAYFYQRHRKWVVILCFVLVASVAVSNFVLGVYQRGLVSVVELPRGVSGIYAWLLLFGLTSLVGIIVHCEMQINPRYFFDKHLFGVRRKFPVKCVHA
jgi:hypothetical protein